MTPKCEGCEKKSADKYARAEGRLWHDWQRKDYYGNYTGVYCDKCYDDPDKYGFHKDDYFDPAYAGERMEEDY